MRTHQIMTRRVVTVGPIVEAAGIKLQTTSADFRGRLPLFGIVSEGDFIRHAEIGTQRKHGWSRFPLGPGPAAGHFVREQRRKVGEVMTQQPFISRKMRRWKISWI